MDTRRLTRAPVEARALADGEAVDACRLLLRELYGEDFDQERERYLYFGDSPNDEPLFREFPHTVGVANVREFLPRMKHHPSYVTKKEGGHGFAEAVRWILRQRGE